MRDPLLGDQLGSTNRAFLGSFRKNDPLEVGFRFFFNQVH